MFSQLLQTTVILSALTSTALASPTPSGLQSRDNLVPDTLNFNCYWNGMRIDGPAYNATMEAYCEKYAIDKVLTVSKPDSIYSLGMDAGVVGTLKDPGNSVGIGMSVKVTTFNEAGFTWTRDACRDYSNKIWDYCRTDQDTTFGGEVTMRETTVVLDPRADNELQLVWARVDKLVGPPSGSVPLPL